MLHRSRLHIAPTLAAAVLLAVAPVALGQQTSLPTTALTLSGDQQAQLTKYIEDHTAKLGDADEAAVRRDRARLVEPLQSGQVSAAFRLAYSAAAAPKLAAAIGGKDLNAINAVVVAGELATDGGIDLLSTALKSESASVRYQAVAGARRTFETLSASAEAISGPAAEKLVRDLAERISVDTDEFVVDGAVRALISGGSVAKPNFAAMRSLAVSQLCQMLAKRAEFAGNKPLSSQMAQTALTAAGGLRDLIAAAGGAALPAPALKETAELMGHFLAHCSRTVRAQALPKTTEGSIRELYAQLSQLSETTIIAGGRAISAQFQSPSRDLAAKLRADTAKSDGDFMNDIEQIAGGSGLLTRAPFEIAGSKFKLR
jgi:hypothetical protein